jgi:anti-sigma B factor antagonist
MLNVEFELNDNIGIFKISGKLMASNADTLKNSFNSHKGNYSNFIFDLGELEFIDSVGLSSLVSLLKNTIEVDGEIKVINLQGQPKSIFEITRVYKIFDIHESLDKAVASFN